MAQKAGPNWTEQASRAQPINAKNYRRGADLEDIAIIEIDPSMPPKWCWLYDLNVHDPRPGLPAVGQEVLIAGVPSQSSLIKLGSPPPAGILQEISLGRVALEIWRKVVVVRNPETWTYQGKQAFSPEFHFGVEYDMKNVPSKIDPGGLSGCGIWRSDYKRMDSGVEVPVPGLLGIENSFNETRACLKVTSIERVVALLNHF